MVVACYKFSEEEISSKKVPCKCLSITLLDPVIKAKKKHYPQTLLEECKYEQEKVKWRTLLMMI